jgi:hypothetical protein
LEVTGDCLKYHSKNLHDLCAVQKYYSGDQMKDEIGGVYGTHGGVQKFADGFG